MGGPVGGMALPPAGASVSGTPLLQVRAEVETECMDMQLLVKGLQHRLLEVVDRHEREKRATVMCQVPTLPRPATPARTSPPAS